MSKIFIFDYIICGLIFGLFGQLGDLSESLLKRSANIKDTSQILQGHGGFLDRLDSLLIATPTYFLVLLISWKYINYLIM